MELRRSRRIQGLDPIIEEEKEEVDKQELGIFRSTYEWAAFVLVAFILPVYYFAAFK